MRHETITARRNFLKNCLASAVVAAAGDGISLPEAAAQSLTLSKSRVVIAQDAQLRGLTPTVDSRRMLNLLDLAMETLFRPERSAGEAWRKIVRPGQLVALKVNTLGGRGLSTSPVLIDAICERLQEAGVRAGDIVVWDRSTEELERAGFHVSTAHNAIQCFGTDQLGYEDDLVMYGSVGSRLSRILTEQCDVLINVPVLKDHDGAGVTVALKNMYGAIHNPNKYHPDGCNPYIADLNMLPEIRSRMRLTICDATTACYEGGPAYKPQYAWHYNALIVSQDPVALDTTGWRIIENKRAAMRLKTLEADGRAPGYLATAADRQHRLGTDDPQRIETVEVGLGAGEQPYVKRS
jgi:uncharacterized protein (DUF362 family)